jgi:hypothetical protein
MMPVNTDMQMRAMLLNSMSLLVEYASIGSCTTIQSSRVLAMMDNAVSMPLTKLRRSLHLHLSRSAARMHAGKLRTRDTRHVELGGGIVLASTSSSESVATIALRQRIQPGHAVSLASIAEHPHKQDFCRCFNHG